MTPEQGIAQLQKQFKSVWLRVPVLVGNEAVNFTLDNFRLQGFMGAVFYAWKQRKISWVKEKPGRAILIGKGTATLKRSIRITNLGINYLAIGTDVKYARAHNEGVNGLGVIQTVKGFSRKNGSKVTAHTRRIVMRIPKRQFMGDSPYLQQRLRRVVSYAFVKQIPGLKL